MEHEQVTASCVPPVGGLAFIEGEIEKRIKSFDQARNYYRSGNFWVTFFVATLSALTTVLIGFGQTLQLTWASLAALVTSALMTVASAWEGYFRNREMWFINTDTLNNLYELKSDIRYTKACKGMLCENEVSDFYGRYQEILRAANKAWMGVRSAQLNIEKKA